MNNQKTGNIDEENKTKTQHTMRWEPLCAILQTIGGKDEPNIVFMRKSYRTLQLEFCCIFFLILDVSVSQKIFKLFCFVVVLIIFI